MYRPSFSFVNSWVELEGRFLMAEFSRRDSVVRIASVYAPNWNPEHEEFFTSCLDFTDPSVPTILGGDFNAVFDRARDRRGSDPAVTVRESFVSMELRFKEFCVLDVWRHLHPDLRAYTWLKRCRWLLVLLHRTYWLPVYLASSCVFLFYCSISFLWSRCRFSRLLYPWIFASWPWKLNVSILRDPVFLQTVGDFWPRWRSREPSFSSLQNWWDLGKEHLKSLAVHHWSGAHNERSLSHSVLSALACHLKGRIDDGVVSEGERVRSRVKWVEECETSLVSS